MLYFNRFFLISKEFMIDFALRLRQHQFSAADIKGDNLEFLKKLVTCGDISLCTKVLSFKI